jgi:hypothetical protein
VTFRPITASLDAISGAAAPAAPAATAAADAAKAESAAPAEGAVAAESSAEASPPAEGSSGEAAPAAAAPAAAAPAAEAPAAPAAAAAAPSVHVEPIVFTLEVTGVDIATGWVDAIRAQMARVSALPAAPKRKALDKAKGAGNSAASSAAAGAKAAAIAAARAASAAAAAASAAASGAARSLWSAGSRLASSFRALAARHSEPVIGPEDIVPHSFWAERSIDLTTKAAANVREDEEGRPAAVLHG